MHLQKLTSLTTLSIICILTLHSVFPLLCVALFNAGKWHCCFFKTGSSVGPPANGNIGIMGQIPWRNLGFSDLRSTSFNPRTILLSSSPAGNAAHLWWAMYQLVHPTLLQSIAFMLWQIYLPKIVRQCEQLSSSPPGSAAHLWWAMMIGWVIWVMKVNWNVKKAPLSHQKMKFSFLDYVQLLMIGRAIWAIKFNWNVTKGPLSHQKMKCSILDYIQLLMIGHAIQATKVDWNVEKGP